MFLARFLRRLIRRGELTLIDADGIAHRMGDPRTGPRVAIRLHDRKLHSTFWINPRLTVGEAYMNGTMTLEHGSVYDLLALIGENAGENALGDWDSFLLRLQTMWRGFAQANPSAGQRNHRCSNE